MFNVSLIAEIKYSPWDSVYKQNFQIYLQIDYLSTYFTRNLFYHAFNHSTDLIFAEVHHSNVYDRGIIDLKNQSINQSFVFIIVEFSQYFFYHNINILL